MEEKLSPEKRSEAIAKVLDEFLRRQSEIVAVFKEEIAKGEFGSMSALRERVFARLPKEVVDQISSAVSFRGGQDDDVLKGYGAKSWANTQEAGLVQYNDALGRPAI